MAIIKHFVCVKCGKEVSEGMPNWDTRKVCTHCIQKEEIKNKLQYLKGLESLSVEERLKRIEEWIYNYKPSKNIYDMRF